MTKMVTYRAVVAREGDYWVITTDADGLHLGGQVTRLEDAAPVMRSIVAAALEVPEESVNVDVDVR